MRPGLSVPTCTVARVKSGRKRDEIAAFLGHLSEESFGTFSVESVRASNRASLSLRTKVFNSLRSSCTQIIETDHLPQPPEIVLQQAAKKIVPAIRNERNG